jgi:hypothetical protein
MKETGLFPVVQRTTLEFYLEENLTGNLIEVMGICIVQMLRRWFEIVQQLNLDSRYFRDKISR